ncbi:hypothetical protein SSABA_v1c08280 [Spiroplasma sabaudiense Ar-1343]|uniref:DUF951 domain-containing protein n=1 Tax=Spiroplasma sabaudiense Ar-1343 TaxID=1276257 RepID=W6AB21_9MOLU|nr:DUF951 domain-containing protein [Spiroplasma sabaudiense]AHI54227.1 hypothetical protein SSABA_v1c08280 [Spiroplasma sabaudiense Ar-1343]
MKINISDIVTLKKPHPSKTEKWEVIRVGVIYKLKSLSVENLIIELKPKILEKSIKTIESRE